MALSLGWIAWIVIGGLAGWVASMIKGTNAQMGLLANIVVGVIGGLQLFDQALIGGGSNGDPQYALLTMVLYLYNAAFSQLDAGYAAAIGVVLFLLVMTLTLIQRRLFGNTEAS